MTAADIVDVPTAADIVDVPTNPPVAIAVAKPNNGFLYSGPIDLEEQRRTLCQLSFKPRRLGADGKGHEIFDIRMYEEELVTNMLRKYYTMCLNCRSLMVTFSCFSAWNKKKKINSYGKIIPAVRREALQDQKEQVRVFFFDDNLDMSGCPQDAGICNLRDVESGNFVEFSDGKNGFVSESWGQHSTVRYSTEYNVVLCLANILDAIEDEGYFLKVIEKHLKPNEKAVVFMDVNSTAICIDTISAKDTSNILLSTMFEFIELKPHKDFELSWDSCKPLKVEKPMTFKQLVKKLSGGDNEYYKSFYCLETCMDFFSKMTAFGDVCWTSVSGETLPISGFKESFDSYLHTMSDACMEDGIVKSWFRCFEALGGGRHAIILNSFGVDPYKLVKETVEHAHVANILQVTVNFDDWEPRDIKKFEEQFA